MALIKVGVVVFFDAVEVVKIINHQPDGLLQAFFAQVCRPVDGVQAGAIAEMETCHGIQRQMRGRALAQDIVRIARGWLPT